LKLPALLSQYLREQKTLSLPGIGIFHLTGSLPSEHEASTLHSSQVQFESKRIKEADDKLINFIKQETGKIKPLAIADLESFIATGMELLNMGKPFELEGIGNIQKKKDGQLEFLAVQVAPTKQEAAHQEHDKKVSVFEDSKYEPKSNPLQKVLAFGLFLGGIAVVLLGGYYFYNRGSNANNSSDDETLSQAPIQQQALDTTANKIDSSTIVKLPPSYRYVLENTNSKKRALKRYNQLKSMAIDVKMDTPDSVNFKLYLVIPSTASDTIRIKDSLHNYYGRKVLVEETVEK
jgi:hypothetical protein